MSCCVPLTVCQCVPYVVADDGAVVVEAALAHGDGPSRLLRTVNGVAAWQKRCQSAALGRAYATLARLDSRAAQAG